MSDLFLNIVNMSISASWLVLTVLLLRFVLKKAPKWVNVLLWGIVAVRLAFPFSIESALSLIPSAETISPGIMMDTVPSIQTGVPAFLMRQEAFKDETFARETGLHQSRHESRSPRQAFHFDIVFHAGPHQKESRIGNSRRSGIGDDRQILALLQKPDNLLADFMLVELMVGAARGLDAVMLQELAAGPGIFGQNQIHLVQDFDGPIGEIGQIPDRSRHQKQFCHKVS